MFQVQETRIKDVKIIATAWHGDARGAFSETYQRGRFVEAGITAEFIQDNQAYSQQVGTLRGLHFQKPPFAQTKLVRVLRGAIYDVAVDVRPGSPSFGHWVGVMLSAANRLQFLVPPGFAHGYVTLEPDTDVLYKVDARYAPECEGGIRWDDPEIGIIWPLEGRNAIIAARDQALPLLAQLPAIEGWRQDIRS
jgi:dTDP-4-dehydrorhamnose 3,5-epimerase